MQDFNIEFLWKDVASGGNGCHAILKTDGGYYVQGRVVTGDERAAVLSHSEANRSGLLDDEDVIFVHGNVLDRLNS
ncbi:hypothetical protein ACWT_5849 [Actinoplanes sp. SE50]|uniref:hypothetical protein n=1 Tax=unclassified Actinoplanes TaxID=2626549 RepID=UPI00023EBDC5|nr:MULTISPECIES: hypothetical protein [unclassified Actinoplanes]AEV86867.1 hypothetical protein ACPL_5980 [Actinoplanes sp. SE50/110]ATO85264.1 hypothetical protein ACWT_5849 [Actinoplanes sp. SE50]SLM02674.1 hypothetical protein ACSP50_5956 [Actinoplanes sp. SE50/110]